MQENIYEVIKARHSVRAYFDTPLTADVVQQLNALIADCNSEGDLHIQLVTDEPEAFGKSLMAHYGKFSNVRNYICMVGKRDLNLDEQMGYYGEKIVLKAQQLGLNTCWVGLSYNKGKTQCVVDVGEKLYLLIAIGYGATQGVPSKSKTPQQICREFDSMPEWFKRGVEFALLAPTAINQQKFKFRFEGENRVKATTSWGPYSKVDLGIARYHFELGADRPIIWV